MSLVSHIAIAQQVKVCGFVRDGVTNEPLIGASVVCPDKSGTVTDGNGFFTVRVDPGKSSLLGVSYIGYQSVTVNVPAGKTEVLNVYLTPGVMMDEVAIAATFIDKEKIGSLEIPIEQITKMPSLTGDADILKAFQLMPGVQAGNEATAGLIVRGGSNDQNLYLIDDVPLYSIDHLGGFMSVFDANAIKKANLYKGYIPARYGGRLSSVLDVKLKDGSAKALRQQVTIGVLSSGYFAEGPVNATTTFMFSLRRCNLDLFMRPLSAMGSSGNQVSAYTFMDLNTKIVKNIDAKNKVGFLYYYGRDKILDVSKSDRTGEMGTGTTPYRSRLNNKWGNMAGAVNWTHVFDNALCVDLKAGQTSFFYKIKEKLEPMAAGGGDGYKASFASGVSDLFVKGNLNYTGASLKAVVGGAYQYHHFKPSVTEMEVDGPDSLDIQSQQQTINENGIDLYGDVEWDIVPHVTLLAGANAQFWPRLGDVALDPRVSLLYSVSGGWVLRADYVQTHQFCHLLATSGSIFSPDLWIPSTQTIKPESGRQFCVGVLRTFNGWEASVSAYHKTMHNLITFKPGVSLLSANPWQSSVETGGYGVAKGVELLVQRKHGKNTGWLGYALSDNKRKFDNLNGGRYFPFKYDRRHEVKCAYMRDLSKHISFSGTWTYTSGTPITLASQKMETIDFNNFGQVYDEVVFRNAFRYDGVNNYRMQAYHRLDVGFVFKKQKEHYLRSIYLGLYNAYNRMNPYTYHYKRESNSYVLKKTTFFPLIPSISYTLEF